LYVQNVKIDALAFSAAILLWSWNGRVDVLMDAFERLLWWLFAGSTGAHTRLQVLKTIKEQPRNAQQMAQLLHLDYTTVRHHLGVLEKNRLIITQGEKYGKLYFLSEVMEANWSKLEEIVSKTQKK
jgi:DNA-binding transcriptional ArsR family regulator